MLSLSAWVRRFKIPIGLFIASRLILIIFQASAISSSDKAAAASWTEPWLRWDATYYTSIAQNGYTFAPETHSSVAFFPLYPALMRVVAPFIGGSVDAAALLISSLALLGALIALQLLAEREGLYSAVRARTMVYLVTYSMGFFLVAAYAESLFLLFTIGCMYFARGQRWTWAIVLGMLATLTRITGVLMVGVVLLEWAASHGFTLSQIHKRETWAALGRGLRAEGWVPLAALGIPLALASYMLYLAIYFGTPMAFLQAHGSVRGDFDFTRVITDVVKVLTRQTPRFDIMTGVGTLFVVLLLLPRIVKMRASYAWYFVLSALIPLTTGLISYMRLMGGVFPLYFALAETELSPRGHAIAMSALVILQILALVVFFNGGFVA